MKISTLLPFFCCNSAIAHVFLSLGQQWNGPSLTARMLVPACTSDCHHPRLIEAVPRSLQGLAYRYPELPRQIAEWRFLRDVQQFDAAYLFPGVSLKTMAQIKAAGIPLVLERVNTYTGYAKRVLDDAYDRLGVAPNHPNTSAKIQREWEECTLADYLICPSSAVQRSFVEAGIPASKLLVTSEGWDPSRFAHQHGQRPSRQPSDEVTVLFLGSVCVRKGAHLLLQAWSKAKINGRLILMGRLEPEIAQTCADLLNRPDVEHRDFQSDYTSIYQAADIFALPSLEEGSPLVTYEAMGNGLPILASPMGAGGIVRDGTDGLIVPPYAEEQWIAALRSLAADRDLRQQMGAAARQRAAEFTWDKVAASRAAALTAKLQPAQPDMLMVSR